MERHDDKDAADDKVELEDGVLTVEYRNDGRHVHQLADEFVVLSKMIDESLSQKLLRC